MSNQNSQRDVTTSPSPKSNRAPIILGSVGIVLGLIGLIAGTIVIL